MESVRAPQEAPMTIEPETANVRIAKPENANTKIAEPKNANLKAIEPKNLRVRTSEPIFESRGVNGRRLKGRNRVISADVFPTLGRDKEDCVKGTLKKPK